MSNPLTRLLDLHEDAKHYELFMALRLIECMYPNKARLGQSTRPKDDPVRLIQNPSLCFKANMIDKFDFDEDGTPTLAVSSFGLFGVNAPLPLHLTEYAYQRQHNYNDPTFIAFLNIFHHRLISFFYRSWANCQPTISLDRPTGDRFSSYIGSFIGVGTDSLRDQDAIPDYAKFSYSGHFSRQVKNASGLVAMLSHFFNISISLEEFVGTWMELPDDGLCYLKGGAEAQTLGMTTVLGKKIWDRQNKFRLVLGPLTYSEYQKFLPGQPATQQLIDMIHLYAGITLQWDAILVLKKEQIPKTRLGKNSRIGWNTWLRNRQPQHDDQQFTLHHPA